MIHTIVPSWRLLSIVALICLLQAAGRAGSLTIDFEGLSDGDIVTNQYAGLKFQNTIALSAGISLNEFEFPPHSGSIVVSDNGGPISIAFDDPISEFSGYFTYAEPLTLTGFDSLDDAVATATSLFSNNEALSGDAGSSPNEFLQVSFAGGMSSVTIAGDPFGGSFVMDDMSYQSVASAVPEPEASLLLLTGLVLLFTRHPKLSP